MPGVDGGSPSTGLSGHRRGARASKYQARSLVGQLEPHPLRGKQCPLKLDTRRANNQNYGTTDRPSF